MSAASSSKNRSGRRGSGRERSVTSSEETKSTILSDRRSGRIQKKTQLFDVDQYARSAAAQRSRKGPLSLKNTKSVF